MYYTGWGTEKANSDIHVLQGWGSGRASFLTEIALFQTEKNQSKQRYYTLANLWLNALLYTNELLYRNIGHWV